MIRALTAAALATVLASSTIAAADPRAAEPLRVAAAADLARAVRELADRYQQATGRPAAITLGSTGLLARQIAEGAPFDLFLAANVEAVDEVVAAGVCRGDSRLRYARGRLAIWATGALPANPQALAEPRWKKVAIANPAHAPYGRAAIQVFERLGITDALRTRLVFGENVQQALQFAQSGNADAAVVALSLVIGGERPYLLVDEGLHRPIEQALVVCGKDPARLRQASELVALLRSSEGAAILRRYGFVVPGGSTR
jgi:molybdate transport system substrate-binding protein